MSTRSPIRFNTPTLVMLSLLSGCSGPSRWAGSVQVVAGVEIVTNPAEPLLSETTGLLVELWEVQEADWIDPSRVHARSGLVTLVDLPASQVHLVSASGQTLPSLGRPGGGPGEFLHPVDAFQAGDRIAVLDGGKGSVEYLRKDGAHLASQRLDGQPWSGFLLEGGTLLVKGEFLSDPTQETLGDWVIIREGQDPTAFTTLPLDPLPEEQGVQCSDLSEWDGGAARMRYTTPQIQLFDRSGSLVGEIIIDLPVEEVASAEREAALEDLRHDLASHGLPPEFAQQNLVVMEERWRVKCRFGPLRFDAASGIAAFLEQNPDDFGSGNATIHLLSREGIYLAKAAFSTPWEDFAMDEGVVYALTRDPATDLSTLAAFRVDLPGSLFATATTVLREAR